MSKKTRLQKGEVPHYIPFVKIVAMRETTTGDETHSDHVLHGDFHVASMNFMGFSAHDGTLYVGKIDLEGTGILYKS